MKIAAIIPSLAYKTQEYLELAVESLRATTDWDIIVVTNGSKDKPDLRHIKGITVHLHTRDQGQCIATNIGAQVVAPDTDYLFISNDDMVFIDGWNDNLRFDNLVFSPNLIEPTNNAGSAPPFIKKDWGLTLEDFSMDRAERSMGLLTSTGHDTGSWDGDNIPQEPGFNFPLFIKKDLWQFLGGYDVAYDPWGSNSDTDLQTRINLAGIIPVRLRDVLVYHFSNKSGTFDGSHQDFYQNNIDYFRDKFGFDRDELGSDVWYNKHMIPKDKSKIKYKQEKYNA